jgi:hypothetical protein
MSHHAPIQRGLAVFLGTALLGAVLSAADSQEIINKIGTRALSPQEIKDYALPAGTVKSAGIPTVGIGEPAYLEVQVEKGTVVNDVAWSLTTVPGGSAATLAESPLGLEIPIYNLGDREVAEPVSRKLLVPDAAGQYLVEATVTTDGAPLELSLYVTAAEYVGVGTIAGASPAYPQCALCHGEFAALNQVAAWEASTHADALVDKIDNVGQPGDHFAEYCLSCHTVGYNTDPLAVNGGFDDVAEAVGWTFPTEAGNHWDDMPNALKQKANVQCESCHGPGSQHGGPVDSNRISASLSAGDCAQCHDSEPYHNLVGEWNLSRHAVATRYPTGSESRQSCVRCHSGIGFIDFADGLEQSEFRFNYEAITCQVCHDPHGEDQNPRMIRKATVILANGEEVTAGGLGKLCINCHQSRQNAETYTQQYSSRFGPHLGPQGDMLAGKNAVEYGKQIASSGHISAIENSCVGCHMHQLESGDPAANLAGGHTFKMTWDNGTPADESDDVPITGSCVQCHGEVSGFNFAQEDYDGDGLIEGVQDEVRGLMDILGNELPPAGPGVSVTPDYTPAQLKAAFTYLFVEEDRSFGIHNTSYTVGILKASIEDVMIDDSDGDGLRDGFEIANFGSLEAQGADDDFDGDGLTNLEEQEQGTDPKLVDTDGDGHSDKDELLLGHNPLDENSNPDVVFGPIVRRAIEMLFYSESGKIYQVQVTDSLESGLWEDVGDPIAGGNDLIQTFFSMYEYDAGTDELVYIPNRFYRVMEAE